MVSSLHRLPETSSTVAMDQLRSELESRFGVSFVPWIQRYQALFSIASSLSINYFLSIPFCPHHCFFCDLPHEGVVPSDDYVEHLVWHMKRVSCDWPWSAESYFWLGAGTATSLSDRQFALLASVMGPTCKCIEADLSTYKKVFDWCQITPIGNLSIGVQTLDPRVRTQYRIQRHEGSHFRDDVEEARALCLKHNVRLNLDFMCFAGNLEVTMEEIHPFLGDPNLDLSIYPHVPYFSSPEFDLLQKGEPLFAEIDRIMADQGYTKLSRNGYYTLCDQQSLQRYFDSDYVVGMGKYGRIVPKNKMHGPVNAVHGTMCADNVMPCSQVSEKERNK